MGQSERLTEIRTWPPHLVQRKLISHYGWLLFDHRKTQGNTMQKSAGSKTTVQSLNKNAPPRPGTKGGVIPKAHGSPTAGGKGDKDGKGDIQAKKAATSSGRKSASK